MAGGLAAAALLAVLGACAAEPERPAPAPHTLSIGRYYWPGTYWVDVADRKGWFAEEGQPVQLVDTNADYAASLDDVVEGRLDTAAFSFFDFVDALQGGADLVGVIATDVSAGAEGVVARPEITGLAALRGKHLGVDVGGYLEHVVAAILAPAGLSLADLVVVDTTGEAAPDLFRTGDLDAVATWEPALSELERDGAGGSSTLRSCPV